MDDKDIILLMRENPEAGLRAANDKYAAVVLTVIKRVLRGNQEDAEECAADAFIKFWETAQSLDPDSSSVRAYLICIARNTAINRYHYLKRHRTTPLDIIQDLLPDAMDVDVAVFEAQQTEVLLESIHALPQPNREIMIRRYFHCQRIQTIADQMGLSKSIVKNRIQFTKKKLSHTLTMKGVSLECI